MRGLIWIIVLFAVAVAIAMGASLYNGNVYVVVEQTMLRINLHAFILGLLALVIWQGWVAYSPVVRCYLNRTHYRGS